MRNNLLTNIGKVTLLTAAASVALPLAAASAADAPEVPSSTTASEAANVKWPTKTVPRSVDKPGYGGRVKGNVSWHDPARWRATWNLKVSDLKVDKWCVRAKVTLDKPNAFDTDHSSKKVCRTKKGGKKPVTLSGKDAHDLRGIKVQMCRVKSDGTSQRCKYVQYVKNYFY